MSICGEDTIFKLSFFHMYQTEHNQSVKAKLLEQLTPKFGDTHSPARPKSRNGG